MKSSVLENYITELRLSRGYSQLYLAQILGIGRQAYSHYETGRNIPPYPAIVKMAELYGGSTESFINKMNLKEEEWKELESCYKIMTEHERCVRTLMDMR